MNPLVDPSTRKPIPISPRLREGHFLTQGKTGEGKSVMLAMVWMSALASGVLTSVMDLAKADLVNLVFKYMVVRGGISPEQIIRIAPFHGKYGVPLNPLASDSPLAAALKAFEITSILARISDGGSYSPRMFRVALRLIEFAIKANRFFTQEGRTERISLFDLLLALTYPEYRSFLVGLVPWRCELTAYLEAFPEAETTTLALASRFDPPLISPKASSSLCADGCVSGSELRRHHTLIDFSHCPFSARMPKEALASFIEHDLLGASFEDGIEKPLELFRDEAPELCRVLGPDALAQTLEMGRSRGLRLRLGSQQWAQLVSASSSLAASIQNNCSGFLLFSPDSNDIKNIGPLIKKNLTGSIRNPRLPDRCLTLREEYDHITRHLQSLRHRELALIEKGVGVRLARTATLPLDRLERAFARAPQERVDAYERGRCGVPFEELGPARSIKEKIGPSQLTRQTVDLLRPKTSPGPEERPPSKRSRRPKLVIG